MPTAHAWRLLFVLKASALNRGMQTGSENLAWRLAERGLEIHVLCGGTRPARHGFAVPPGVAYHFTGGDGLPGDHVRLYRELRATIAFDAVIGWIRNLTPLAVLEQAGSDRPVFVANEGDLSRPRRPTLARRLVAALVEKTQTAAQAWRGELPGIERIAGVAAISRVVQDNVTGAYGLPLARTVVIPRGIDHDFLRPAPGKDYAATNRPPRLLFTGNIVKSKGLGDVVEGLRHVAMPVELVLCGNHQAYLHELEARIAEIGAGHTLTWAGALDRDALLGQLQAADVFVFCSWSEGLGKSLLEAMACGLPVVVSDIRAFADIVRDHENGFVVPLGDARRIGQAIDAYVGDPALRASCGRNARLTIETRFNAASEVDAWLRFLARQLGAQPWQR